MSNLTHASKRTPPRHDGFHLGSSHGQMIRQFTPNWFAMTMGTGIVFLILLALPMSFRAATNSH